MTLYPRLVQHPSTASPPRTRPRSLWRPLVTQRSAGSSCVLQSQGGTSSRSHNCSRGTHSRLLGFIAFLFGPTGHLQVSPRETPYPERQLNLLAKAAHPCRAFRVHLDCNLDRRSAIGKVGPASPTPRTFGPNLERSSVAATFRSASLGAEGIRRGKEIDQQRKPAAAEEERGYAYRIFVRSCYGLREYGCLF